MDVPIIDLKAQYRSLKPEIDRVIQAVLDGGQFIGGEFVAKFEDDFATLHKAPNCIGVANGTDAILVALKACGLQRDDEVIIPAFGWISASEMTTLAGGKPVFCDVLPGGTLDPALIEGKITNRTRGVVIVHLYGQAAHAQKVKEICAKHGLFFIEDCAQAHLTSESSIPVGMIGDAGAFSFYPTKNLGAYGDAGCILTQNKKLGDSMRLIANHGGLDRHEMEGINSRLDPLQAAILSVKCAHLEEWTNRRIEHARHYNSVLSDVPDISLPAVRPDTVHTFHQYVISTTRRDDLRTFLEAHRIQTLVHYPVALHNLPAYRHLGLSPSDFPEATRCQGEVLSLPVFPELAQAQVSYVGEKIKKFFKS